MKYRKKPVVIEAVRLPVEHEDPTPEVMEFLNQMSADEWDCDRDGGLLIYTLEGTMRADPGDYIIKGVNGEFYPCKPDIFEKTYESVQGENDE